MSFKLYVGNIPSQFNIDDLQHTFSEFQGLKVEKLCRKQQKCFSFISCVDFEQLLSVVERKNNVIVGGRNLIIRACDAELQNYVNLILEQKNESPSKTFRSTSPQDQTQNHSKMHHSNSRALDLDSSSQPYKTQRDSLHSRFSRLSLTSDEYECPEDIDHDLESDQPIFECLDDHGNLSIVDYNDEFENYAWISLTNFPLGTPSRDIMHLLTDHNPVSICMVCNKPRSDKALTEAIVGFLSQQDADDVILNFDNTLWRRRCLLVTDCEDLTIMKELISVVKRS